MIATTGEMPVNCAEVSDLDLSRSIWAGLSDRAARVVDNRVLEVMLRFNSRGHGEALIVDVELGTTHRLAEVDLGEVAMGQQAGGQPPLPMPSEDDNGWHHEPDFIPGRVARGIVLGPPDFSDVTDGVEWE